MYECVRNVAVAKGVLLIIKLKGHQQNLNDSFSLSDAVISYTKSKLSKRLLSVQYKDRTFMSCPLTI